MKICVFPECGRPIMSRDLCQTHYQQQRRGEELRPIKKQNRVLAGQCRGPECDSYARYSGLCWAHKRQQDKGQDLYPLWSTKNRVRQTCSFEGCVNLSNVRGLCLSHSRQLKRTGELRPIHEPTYRYIHAGGYVILIDSDHPNAQKSGRLLEHVKVMSEILGRPLFKDENVHHINGVRDDNRPENLELWSTSQPKGQRVEDKLVWARMIVERYGSIDS